MPSSSSDPFDEVDEALVDELVNDVDADDAPYQEDDDSGSGRRFMFLHAAPAWLVSTLVHVLILLILGLLTIANPIEIVNVLTASATSDNGPEIEEFAIDDSQPNDIEEVSEEITEPVDVAESMEIADAPAVEVPMEVMSVPIEMSDFASEMAPVAAQLQTLSAATSSPMNSRSVDMKKKLLREYGGTESSEAAVQEALKWFTRHQMPNGAWTLQHNLVCRNACSDACVDPKRGRQINAATALALLPFLGAGQTHIDGEFKKVVGRGLQFLIANGKPGRINGMPVIDYRGPGGNMYDHGLATILLCEAYAMTGDSAIAGPAQAAINFIVVAQCRDGGWRYTPRQKDGGDTSVVGWQVMALKSGYMGHLVVPPASIQGSMLFLDKVQTKGGAEYGYSGPSTKFRGGTTAVGLLCRMYTGWKKDHPAIIKGVDILAKRGPSEKGKDLYYDYYAAQVLRQYGGPQWDTFNAKLRDSLVASQAQSGGAKGSWHMTNKGHFNESGRLCQTAFATMILEVYYRHMPLYADEASEEDFPL